jgi:hypothetical protein
MQKIIPQTPENLSLGMNDLDNPKVLSANQWQLIENSFPGLTGKPRNGLNELGKSGFLSLPNAGSNGFYYKVTICYMLY